MYWKSAGEEKWKTWKRAENMDQLQYHTRNQYLVLNLKRYL